MEKKLLIPSIIAFFLISTRFLSFGQPCPIPEVNLGNDTLICPGESFYLDAGTHSSITWKDGSTDRYLLVSQPGVYSVTVKNDCGNSATDEIVIELAEAPVFSLIVPVKEYFCKGEIVNVNSEVQNNNGGLLYEWLESNSTDASINVDTSGTYTLRVTNEFGCKTISSVNLEFQYPYEEEKILLTSYDPSEGKNIIIWSRTHLKRTQSFLLFGGTSGNDLLTETSYKMLNLHVDQRSDPSEAPTEYNLQLRDSCNNLSMFNQEKAHKTMHLNAYTNPDGQATLEWTPYQGFNYEKFYVYQGTDPEKLVPVDSLNYDPKTNLYTYIDSSAREGILYFYDVRVKTPEVIFLDRPGQKKAGSGPFVHSLSNLEDNMIRGTGMDELDIVNQSLRIYPNPVKDNVRISCINAAGRNVRITLHDITGTEVARFNEISLVAGGMNFSFQPGGLGLDEGVYILKMEFENLGTLTRKLIKY